MKPWLFVVNDVGTLRPQQTTAELIACAAGRAPVWVTEADAFEAQPDGRLTARARRLVDPIADGAGAVRAAQGVAPELLDLDDVGLVFMRTNPGRAVRPMVHEVLLDQLAMAEGRGVPILNSIRGLRRARSKMYLHAFPRHVRPATLVTADAAAARAFIAGLDGPAVIKPLAGTQGRDVFFIDRAAGPNLNALLDVVLREGHAIIQAKAESDRRGDTRLIALDGELLRVDGAACAVRRVPQGVEFRSNHHVGAKVQPPELEPYHEALVAAVGPRLRADGLFLVGLDTVGGKIIECNVFSPGGLGDAGRFGGVDFIGPVIDAAARRAR